MLNLPQRQIDIPHSRLHFPIFSEAKIQFRLYLLQLQINKTDIFIQIDDFRLASRTPARRTFILHKHIR
jgi:hypothetical protein